VTYAQYQAFVTAEDGFDKPEWWAGIPVDYQRQPLADQRTQAPNNPRDSISWYQSVVFARWLDHRYRHSRLFDNLPPLPIVANTHSLFSSLVGTRGRASEWQIRLPTEWEWRWAAQGGVHGWGYPWGSWQAGYANTIEAGLGRANAVGMYPHGAAACGALDMAGSLWEWCLNDDNKRDNRVDQISISSNEQKALRGASFDDRWDYADSLYRNSYHPGSGSYNYGFRLVVSSPIRF